MHGEKIVEFVKLAYSLNIKKNSDSSTFHNFTVSYINKKRSFAFFVLKKKLVYRIFSSVFFNIKNVELFYFYMEL